MKTVWIVNEISGHRLRVFNEEPVYEGTYDYSDGTYDKWEGDFCFYLKREYFPDLALSNPIECCIVEAEALDEAVMDKYNYLWLTTASNPMAREDGYYEIHYVEPTFINKEKGWKSDRQCAIAGFQEQKELQELVETLLKKYEGKVKFCLIPATKIVNHVDEIDVMDTINLSI